MIRFPIKIHQNIKIIVFVFLEKNEKKKIFLLKKKIQFNKKHTRPHKKPYNNYKATTSIMLCDVICRTMFIFP